MSEFEQNMPDDFWRKAFEEATETPPPRVWNAVERRLDDGDGAKVLPLWGAGLVSSQSFVWGVGVAAAVALLLVGWWTLRATPPGNLLARRQPAGQVERVVAVPTPMATDCWPSPGRTPTRPSISNERNQEAVALNQKLVSSPRGRRVSMPAQPMNRPATESLAQLTPDQIAATPESVGEPRNADAQLTQRDQRPVAAAVPLHNRVAFAGVAAASVTPANELSLVLARPTEPGQAQALSFDPMRTSAPRLREPGPIQRIVWFGPAGSVMEPTMVQPKRETREVWASVSLMPGAFNPSVTVRTVQPSFANANALSSTNASQPSVSSRANFSVAYQAGAGIQLTERWSVESGVGYLTGRSTVESPVQAAVPGLQSVSTTYSGQSANLYVDALRSSSGTSSATNSAVASFDYAAANNRYTAPNSYSPQTRQSLTNDYQFVQVPVQIGYQLRPRKRLSLALLGGFLSNIFVRNTVGDELVITTRNGVYRPVSWAATVGARFRYRPSRQWSASLAGIYQPSLGLSTRPESAVQSRPTSTGMSVGVDYHF